MVVEYNDVGDYIGGLRSGGSVVEYHKGHDFVVVGHSSGVGGGGDDSFWWWWLCW